MSRALLAAVLLGAGLAGCSTPAPRRHARLPPGAIGLHLRRRQGRWEVFSLAAGGPAALDGRLKPGDVVEALAQGDGPWTEIGALRRLELLRLLRGDPGTVLRLRIAGSPPAVLALTRARLRRAPAGAPAAAAAPPPAAEEAAPPPAAPEKPKPLTPEERKDVDTQL